MAIANSDILLFLPHQNPFSDSAAARGVIRNTAHASGAISPIFTAALASAAIIEMLSSEAGDTRTVTIKGRLATGAYSQEDVVLNGTTVVQTAVAYLWLLSVEVSATHATRTVTVRHGTSDATVLTIPPLYKQKRCLFPNAVSDPSNAVDRYELVYVENISAQAAVGFGMKIKTDASGKHALGVAPATGDIAEVTTGEPRKSAPSSVTFVTDNSVVTLPSGASLNAGAHWGYYVRQGLAANNAYIGVAITLTPSWSDAA